MRCPKCGSLTTHFLTDITRNQFYLCTCGIRALSVSIKQNRVLFFHDSKPCATVVDQRGRKFTGHIAYITNGKVETVRIPA